MQAIDAGAVDFVQKPTALATNALFSVREELIGKVKASALAPLETLHPRVAAPPAAAPSAYQGKIEVVVIGISTGGPQALRHLIPQFPRDFPVPVAIVLHMPVGYTAMFAEKLDEISTLEVREAGEGDVLEPGVVFVGPAGRHLRLRKKASGSVVTEMAVLPLDKPHRPSVDVLFQSAAEVYRSKVLAVVMTGMGDDGKQGAAWVKAQGGTVLTESEESCVIYGMPRAVVESGLSDGSCALGSMAAEIAKRL
jgi:two-component system chemotaxis response regulator CheB